MDALTAGADTGTMATSLAAVIAAAASARNQLDGAAAVAEGIDEWLALRLQPPCGGPRARAAARAITAGQDTICRWRSMTSWRRW